MEIQKEVASDLPVRRAAHHCKMHYLLYGFLPLSLSLSLSLSLCLRDADTDNERSDSPETRRQMSLSPHTHDVPKVSFAGKKVGSTSILVMRNLYRASMADSDVFASSLCRGAESICNHPQHTAAPYDRRNTTIVSAAKSLKSGGCVSSCMTIFVLCGMVFCSLSSCAWRLRSVRIS